MTKRRIRLTRKELDTGKTRDRPTHCFHCGAKLPDNPELPTGVPPRTNERIRVMMARAERGLPLKDPRDCTAEDRGAV